MTSKLTAKDWMFRVFIAFSILFVPSLYAYRFFIEKHECEEHVRLFYDLGRTNPPEDALKKAENLMMQKCADEKKDYRAFLKMYDNMHKPRAKPY